MIINLHNKASKSALHIPLNRIGATKVLDIRRNVLMALKCTTAYLGYCLKTCFNHDILASSKLLENRPLVYWHLVIHIRGYNRSNIIEYFNSNINHFLNVIT